MIEKVTETTIEQPVSIREQVYKRINEMILSGKIAPGERIMENKLAKLFGVSRTPISEALHVLDMEGFLEAIPRVGYQVKEIVWDEIVDICEIRKVTETLAACWAMEKITQEELDALQHNLDLAEEDMKGGYQRRFIDRDVDFHDILVRASGSRRLAEICQTLRRHMTLYRTESMYEPEMVKRVLEDHRSILDRLRAHDVAGVSKAISDHLDRIKHEVLHYASEIKKGRDSTA